MNLKNKLTDSSFFSGAENFLNENGPTLSMFGAFVALGLSLYEAFKASKKVVNVEDQFEHDKREVEKKDIPEEEKTAEIKELKASRNIKYVLAYKWAFASGGASVAMMFLCNYLNGAKIATLTTALAFNQNKIKKLIRNSKEVIGEEKFKEIDDKTLEDLVKKNFVDEDGPIVIRPDTSTPGMGDLYIDTYSGVQFQFRGTEEQLRQVFKRATDKSYGKAGLPTSRFYSMLGIPTPAWAWGVWGPNLPCMPHIGKRDILGATFKTIEFDYMPGTENDAGVNIAIA